MKRTKIGSLISMWGFLVFFAIVCLLHFLRPEKNIRSCFVSEYAVGNYGWLMTIAFYVLALAAALLLINLLQDGKASAIGYITLSIFSAGILLAGIFPTDLPETPPTSRGLIHGFAALIALLSIAISMMAWGVIFKKKEGWEKFGKPSIFYGVVSFLLLILFIGSPISYRGLTQRFLLVWDASWMVLVSWKLHEHPAVIAEG